MENIFNRLKFVHHDEIFATREEACSYVINHQAIDRPTVVAEPMVLLYESGSEEKGPNVILAIGSRGIGTQSITNRTFFIDTKKTEEELVALEDRLDQAIRELTLIPLESNTLKLSTETTENGTNISGDVKIADYQIVSGIVKNNIITETENGIYAFVDVNYDEATSKLTFTVNGVTKEFQLPADQHVVKGWYDPTEESIFIKLADGSKVQILVTKLIEEWTVDDNPKTPIVLRKDHFSAVSVDHEGIYDWQDILSADVRIARHIPDNILTKDGTGRYLYVKGTADNILYDGNTTVKEAIRSRDTSISNSTGNIIYRRSDGFYANVDLEYKAAENKLEFSRTSSNGETETFEIELNSIQLLDDITYDSTKEAIIIRYQNAKGEYKRVEIPVSSIIEEWDVQSDAHTIQLQKFRSEGAGHDILTADAKISMEPDNILVDKNHELYVKGTADNIDYNGVDNVKVALDKLNASLAQTNEDLADEKNARIDADNAINIRIDELSANTEGRLKSVVNEDHSINVDNADPVNPVIKVNLSEETEHGKPNIIKLNNDGLYAGVDLEYNPSSNTITFTTTNETKEFHIEPSKVIDSIYYDKTKEALIIVYTVKGTTEPVITEVSLKDVIEEWNVSDNTDGAVRLSKSRVVDGTDILSAEVLVSNTHDDNMLVNDNGALYVSSAKIDAEIARSIAKDEELDGKITAERERAIEKETELSNKIDAEIARSTEKDDQLNNKINDEILRANSTESELRALITSEASRAQVEEQRIESRLNDEIARSTTADESLQIAIDNEKAAREADVQDLEDAIEAATLTFNDTTSVKINKSDSNVVTANVKVANADDNIIKIDNTREGVYASVRLSYDAAANKIKLITSNGEQDYIQLNAGSVVDDITYDTNERSLILTYTGADGISHVVKFPVNDLFNDWIVNNPSSGSAIELTKTVYKDGTSRADELAGRVLLTNLNDNMVQIVNNGLYVSGSGITKANEDIECLKKEVDVIGRNVIGLDVPECGEDGGNEYKYTANNLACVINSATSLYNADELLDEAICSMIKAWNELMLGSDTPTTHMFARDIARNRHLFADVRLSHGSMNSMTDDDLTIKDISSDEFTETNALRIVDFTTEGVHRPDSPYNGLYLSSIWGGGEYDGDEGEVVEFFYGNTREL